MYIFKVVPRKTFDVRGVPPAQPISNHQEIKPKVISKPTIEADSELKQEETNHNIDKENNKHGSDESKQIEQEHIKEETVVTKDNEVNKEKKEDDSNKPTHTEEHKDSSTVE